MCRPTRALQGQRRAQQVAAKLDLDGGVGRRRPVLVAHDQGHRFQTWDRGDKSIGDLGVIVKHLVLARRQPASRRDFLCGRRGMLTQPIWLSAAATE